MANVLKYEKEQGYRRINQKFDTSKTSKGTIFENDGQRVVHGADTGNPTIS